MEIIKNIQKSDLEKRILYELSQVSAQNITECRLEKLNRIFPNNKLFRCNSKDGSYIIKVEKDSKTLEKEFSILKLLSEKNLSTPYPHFVLPNVNAVVMSEVNGESLQKLLMFRSQKAHEAVKNCARWLYEFHALKCYYNNLKCSDKINVAFKINRLDLMQKIKEEPKVMIHGQFTPSNVIVSPTNEVIAIDFEEVTRSSRYYDICTFLNCVGFYTLSWHLENEMANTLSKIFIREYFKELDFNDSLFKAYNLVSLYDALKNCNDALKNNTLAKPLLLLKARLIMRKIKKEEANYVG